MLAETEAAREEQTPGEEDRRDMAPPAEELWVSAPSHRLVMEKLLRLIRDGTTEVKRLSQARGRNIRREAPDFDEAVLPATLDTTDPGDNAVSRADHDTAVQFLWNKVRLLHGERQRQASSPLLADAGAGAAADGVAKSRCS